MAMSMHDKRDLEKIASLHQGFKSASRRAIEISLAEAMNAPAWKDHKHKGHLDAVRKVYETYVRMHRTK